MNVVWWKTDDTCKGNYPRQYWWLFVNIIVYFFFFFIMIFVQIKSWFVSPDEKEVEAEVNQDEQEALNEGKTANAVN